MINKGDVVGSYEVMAAHTQDDHDGKTRGVALGYSPQKREYVVWLVNGDEPHTGIYTFDFNRALLKYVERVTNWLYITYNQTPPGVSFEVYSRSTF